MAMTAPGTGSGDTLLQGVPTASWRKTFRDSQAQRLRLVPAKAGIGKKLPIIEKVTAENFRDAEDEMPVWDLLQDIHAEPLPEFHHAFLMARWTKACPHEDGDAFVYKRMPANIHGRNPCIPDQVEDKLHTGKTIVRIAAVEKTIDHLLDIGPPEALQP